jgi:hypothetical protein
MLSGSAAVVVRFRSVEKLLNKYAVDQLPNDFEDLIGTMLPDQLRWNLTVE